MVVAAVLRTGAVVIGVRFKQRGVHFLSSVGALAMGDGAARES